MGFYSVEVDSVAVELLKGSMLIEQRIEERSVASFTIIDRPGTASYQKGQPVEIDDEDGVLIFGGLIDDPQSEALSPSSGLYHIITCVDWNYLADKRLVVASYVTTDAGDIVTNLHTNYLSAEGITIGSIQTGPEVAEAIFNYITVAQALDALAELAGFIWYIDENKALYFIDRTTYAAPWAWTTATPKPAGSKALLSGANPLYRNRQYVRGGTGLTAQQTEDRTGDGENTAFTMGYPLASAPTITEDAGGKTVGIKGIDSGKDYYWSKGDSVILAEVAPGNAVAVQVVYFGQYPLITLATDEGERVARQAIEGGTGIVENIVDEAFHESAASSNESAKAKIAEYARDAQRFIYQTTSNGIKPGQLQPITYSRLGLSATEMLIEAVAITAMGNLIIYDVTAIVGPVTGSWARFFATMIQDQKASIRIGDSLLVVLLQLNENLPLAEVTAQYEDDFSSGIVNRWIYLPTTPPTTGSPHNVQHEALDLSEVPSIVSHATEDYDWDEAGVSLYGWATWA